MISLALCHRGGQFGHPNPTQSNQFKKLGFVWIWIYTTTHLDQTVNINLGLGFLDWSLDNCKISNKTQILDWSNNNTSNFEI